MVFRNVLRSSLVRFEEPMMAHNLVCFGLEIHLSRLGKGSFWDTGGVAGGIIAIGGDLTASVCAGGVLGTPGDNSLTTGADGAATSGLVRLCPCGKSVCFGLGCSGLGGAAISRPAPPPCTPSLALRGTSPKNLGASIWSAPLSACCISRSEERRVGKE